VNIVPSKKIVFAISVVLAVVLLLVCITFALMYATHRIESTATVKVVGVGIYQDELCNFPLTNISWGFLDPGDTENFTAHIKNESNVPISLTMYTDNWEPENATDFIDLSWNYDGSSMPIDSVVQVVFFLELSSEIQGINAFSFEIFITGAG
jgi:hypothetical protein